MNNETSLMKKHIKDLKTEIDVVKMFMQMSWLKM